MKIAIFVTIWSAGMSSADLNDHILANALDFLKADSAVQAIEIYTPESGDVPVMDDVPAPTVIVQIDLDDAEAAKKLVRTDAFKQALLDKAGFGAKAAIEKINLEITEKMNFPLPGMTTAPARKAPMSFVVRYYGPVKNGPEFVKFYTENHPPILSKFPDIRNVLCYLPLGWRENGEITDDQLIIGNEVVFDDLDGLNRALQSDILPEAKEDSSHFQEYGYSTHHAMHRELVYSKP